MAIMPPRSADPPRFRPQILLDNPVSSSYREESTEHSVRCSGRRCCWLGGQILVQERMRDEEGTQEREEEGQVAFPSGNVPGGTRWDHRGAPRLFYAS